MEAVRVKVKEEVMIVVDDLDGFGGGMIFEEDEEEEREKVDEIYCRSGGGGMTSEEKFDEIDGGSGGGSGGEVTFEDEVEKKEEKLDEIDGGGSGGEVTFEDGAEKEEEKFDEIYGGGSGGEVTFEDGAEKEEEKFDEIYGGGSGCGDGVVKLEQEAPIVKYNGGGGDGGIEIKEEEKLEQDEVDVNGGGGGGGGGSGGSSDSSSSIRLPKPMSGLHDFSPPPFLTKTYEMVEDPATDLIVSWNVGGGESFIVWDDIEFSTSLLPRYFKHSNFSSFIRQLNTYGFRKVHHDRWEFANEAFLRGKRNLLKNIKRRQVGLSSSNLQQEAKNVAEMAKIELETQVESLKKDQNLLQAEILKLRQQQETSENHVAAFERRIQCSAFSHQKLVCFFRKTVGSPNFMEKMKRRQRRELGCCGCGGSGIGKRRRLVNGTNQVGLLPKDTTAQYASMDDIHHHHQQQQQQSGSCPVLDHITNVNSVGNYPNSNSPQYDNLFLEKMKEDLFDESEAEEVPSGGSNSSYLHDLQDLIMTSDWNNYAQLGEEQMNFT